MDVMAMLITSFVRFRDSHLYQAQYISNVMSIKLYEPPSLKKNQRAFSAVLQLKI